MEREMGAWDLAFEPILARRGGLTIAKASPSVVMARGGREGVAGGVGRWVAGSEREAVRNRRGV